MVALKTGLTINQVVEIVGNEIATDQLAGVLQRLPEKYFDRERQLFRPITPALLLALSLTPAMDDDTALDTAVCDMIEVVALDPAPELPAWATLPGGKIIRISNLLTGVAGKIATMYAESPKKSSSRARQQHVAK